MMQDHDRLRKFMMLYSLVVILAGLSIFATTIYVLLHPELIGEFAARIIGGYNGTGK